MWRPQSIRGINHNYSWIKVEKIADLPKEKGSYYFKLTESNFDDFTIIIKDVKKLTVKEKEKVTHYRLIKDLELPVY